jgi:hypothetical protein
LLSPSRRIADPSWNLPAVNPVAIIGAGPPGLACGYDGALLSLPVVSITRTIEPGVRAARSGADPDPLEVAVLCPVASVQRFASLWEVFWLQSREIPLHGNFLETCETLYSADL